MIFQDFLSAPPFPYIPLISKSGINIAFRKTQCTRKEKSRTYGYLTNNAFLREKWLEVYLERVVYLLPYPDSALSLGPCVGSVCMFYSCDDVVPCSMRYMCYVLCVMCYVQVPNCSSNPCRRLRPRPRFLNQKAYHILKEITTLRINTHFGNFHVGQTSGARTPNCVYPLV